MENREFIKLLGIALLLAIFVVWLQFFISIYLNPEKRICVSIDNYGEANLEMFLIVPLIIVFGLWALILIIQDIRRNS